MVEVVLTRCQRKALKFLRDDQEYGDLVFESGAGWYLGDNPTNGKLAFGLIRLCLITKCATSGGCDRWEINESGRRALEGKPPYPMADGTYSYAPIGTTQGASGERGECHANGTTNAT